MHPSKTQSTAETKVKKGGDVSYHTKTGTGISGYGKSKKISLSAKGP